MTRRLWPCLCFGLFAACASLSPALAAFHLIKVVEVFPGTEVQPSAQYVVLQMYASGQTVVGTHPVRVYGATGTVLGTFTFGGSVANGANQAKILISTTEAATFFGVTANLAMTPVIPLAGGAVCFDNIDCVAWGNFSGVLPSTAGTPARRCATVGLELGSALKRRLDISGGATTLDALDDTNSSANDFVFGTAAPRNNAGVAGTIPPAVCGNGTLESLEACDDADTDPGDGCSPACEVEACGNCTVDAGETCEPPGAGLCSATCQLVVAPGEVSAPGNPNPLRFTTRDTLIWQDGAQIGAASFNVYRGDVSNLALGQYGSCFASPVATNTTTDASDPASGVTWFYLVTARNAAGEGPAGNNSQGAARVITAPCP